MEAIDTNNVILFTEFMEQSQITVKEIEPLSIEVESNDYKTWFLYYKITLHNKATNADIVIDKYGIGEGVFMHWACDLKPIPIPAIDPKNDFYESERNQIKRENSRNMSIKSRANRIKAWSRGAAYNYDKQQFIKGFWKKWMPKPIGILYSIILDAQSIEYNPVFLEWAKEMGYDGIEDYEKARRSYDQCCQEKVDLMWFLGNDWDTVMNDPNFEMDY
jgi:hypothetical protein